MNRPEDPKLHVAVLPLSDGRQVVLPLDLLAEVTPLDDAAADKLEWRGAELVVESLDALFGLDKAADGQMNVGIVRSGGSGAPFRAMAFSGIAEHDRITAKDLEPSEASTEGPFIGATRLRDRDLLIPDVKTLFFS